MDRYESCLDAISQGRAPMALVPSVVMAAIRKRESLVRRRKRFGGFFGLLIMLGVGIPSFALLLFYTPPDRQVAPYVAVIDAIGLCLLVAWFVWWTQVIEPVLPDNCALKGRNETLRNFIFRFMALTVALGERNQSMTDWPAIRIAEYAKARLRMQAVLVKIVQTEKPGDLCAELGLKTKFKDLHDTFTKWGLEPGPWGPYFAES